MLVEPERLSPKERYKLLIGSVLPRPIAWVSSMSAGGALNLAPFSFFTVASTEPMTLLFCPQRPMEGGEAKDTLRNIEAVPEFVVNLTNEETAEAMNLSATPLPHGRSEFEWAGLTPAASRQITVPRVAEAPIAFECRLQQVVTISDGPGGGAVVFGLVVAVHVRDDLYRDGYIDLERYRPIGRLAGAGYTRVTESFEMVRVPLPEPD